MDLNWDLEFEDIDANAEREHNKIASNCNKTNNDSSFDDDFNDDDSSIIDNNNIPIKSNIKRPSNADLMERISQQSPDPSPIPKTQKPKTNISEIEIPSEIIQYDDWSASNFYSHEKHVFIVTWGGRPLYSRYGSVNDQRMTSFMGVISLFPTNIERVNILTEDEIYAFTTGDTKFVYLICGPLYFFAISKTQETVEQVRNQLRYIYLLIISQLTNVYERTLTVSAGFDMRTIFGSHDYMLLSALIDEYEHNPCFLFDSYAPLVIDGEYRSAICAVICECKKEMSKKKKKNVKNVKNEKVNDAKFANKLLYSLMFIEHHLVSCTQPKNRNRWLNEKDIILLTHLVKYTKSFKQSEGFIPICLPHFEPSGFVYCYVSYFAEDEQKDDEHESNNVCLLLITLDSNSFKNCQQLRINIERRLKIKENLLKIIHIAYDIQCRIKSEHIFMGNMKDIMSSVISINVNDIEIGDSNVNHCIPQVFTFWYHSIRDKQYFQTKPIKLYDTMPGRKKLFQRLQHLHDRVHGGREIPAHEIYFERCITEDTGICKMVHGEYEIYVLCNSFTSKKDAADIVSKLVNWCSLKSKTLFFTPSIW